MGGGGLSAAGGEEGRAGGSLKNSLVSDQTK